MSKLRLAIGIPAYGGSISMHHARMWMEFGNTLGGSHERFELVAFDTADINGVDQARNYLFARAVTAGADWLLMVDADTWVEPTGTDQQAGTDAGFLLLRMLSEADRSDASVVVAPVNRRLGSSAALAAHEHTRELMIYKAELRREHFMDMGLPYEFGTLSPMSPAQRGLVEIDAAATAVFAFNVRRAVEHQAMFKFTISLSEDMEFCRQTRAREGRILVDTRIRTGHLSRQFPLYSSD